MVIIEYLVLFVIMTFVTVVSIEEYMYCQESFKSQSKQIHGELEPTFIRKSVFNSPLSCILNIIIFNIGKGAVKVQNLQGVNTTKKFLKKHYQIFEKNTTIISKTLPYF